MKAPRFAPLRFDDLEPRPDWWRVRPEEIADLCSSVRRGRAEKIADSSLGYPVCAVIYNDYEDAPPQTNWSAGSASGKPACYAPEGKPQTVLFCAGIHGAEAESVAAMVNLIRMFETGADFRGKSDPELMELASHYRLVIVPCVNMDGRAISPDHLRRASLDQFNLASQGLWADGSVISWLGSKEHFPLPLDRVQFPGGYPNAEGFNIMHDACAGNLRTAEAAGLLKFVERYRVDCALNGHSCSYPPSVLAPSLLNYEPHIRRGTELACAVNRQYFEAGLRPNPAAVEPKQFSLNLNTQMALASGALALTLECNVSSFYRGELACIQTFDEMIEPNYILLKETLKSGLEAPLSDRAQLLRRA